MSNYDINLILNPNLSADQVAVEKEYVENTVRAAGAEIVDVEDAGNRRLAYAVQKDREGYFVFYRVTMAGNPEKAVASVLRLRDNIRRVLVVKDRPEWKTKKA